MKLPKGTIFASVVLSLCILFLGAGAGAAGASPSDGNSAGWQIGAQQGTISGEQAPPGNGGGISPGGQKQMPPGQRDNRTALMQGAPGFFDRGNMTLIDNRTPIELDNRTLPLDGTHPMHGNMTRDNRTPPDFNATEPLGNSPNSNVNEPGQSAGAGRGDGANTGQKSPIDELIEALSRFFNKSS